MTEKGLCGMLGIRLPLLSAPMSGASCPALAAAVSNAGGLGFLAADLLAPDAIAREVSETRRLTDKPFGVNLRIPPRDRGDAAKARKVAEALSLLRAELGVPGEPDLDAAEPDFEEQFEAVLDSGVKVVSSSFGGFREAWCDRLHKAGVFVIGAATTLREAKVMRAADCDAVILQGAEAGGPRLYFESEPEESLVGLSVLVSEAARAVRLPLIAAGGIGSAAGAAGAVAAGASAVMVGTALAFSPESAAPDLMKKSLVAASDCVTCVTDVFSGRLERVMANGLVEALARSGVTSAGYPYQRLVMREIMDAAAAQDRPDLLRMPMGQGADIMAASPAGDTVERIAAGLPGLMRLLGRV